MPTSADQRHHHGGTRHTCLYPAHPAGHNVLPHRTTYRLHLPGTFAADLLLSALPRMLTLQLPASHITRSDMNVNRHLGGYRNIACAVCAWQRNACAISASARVWPYITPRRPASYLNTRIYLHRAARKAACALRATTSVACDA